MIDPTGIWFHREGQYYLTGRSPGPGEPDPDEPPLEVDEAMFLDVIWPVLATRSGVRGDPATRLLGRVL